MMDLTAADIQVTVAFAAVMVTIWLSGRKQTLNQGRMLEQIVSLSKGQVELREDIKTVKTDLRGEIQAAESRLKEEIGLVRTQGRETYGMVMELRGTVWAPAAQTKGTAGVIQRDVEELKAKVNPGGSGR